MLHPFPEIENPSLYTKAELYFFDLTRLLKEDGINIEEYSHKGNRFINTMIDLARERLPINANLFLTAYNSLSAHDQSMLFRICVYPLLSKGTERQKENFCSRVEQLLASHG
ncbi:MAG: hypothetical protein ACD_78C00006G0005 [uncultured bacterium (gcode 4)]|uniref:Uncharacterized protein n=1 Tax=uncultured bacterium (gcode 4) TaxID=1234023 RepID=K1Y067_9BACT|nr:MAG: hypothetical protein ACD_78C00006G0005 [uncultured bacterium (gcode 4)]HBB27394.1 hypothetical protein [Candidatus Gracilibacteria bacterium]